MVTFETKVWEKDWRYILKGDYLNNIIDRCNYDFYKRIIIINNVLDRKEVEKFAQIKVEQGVIDDFYFAEDYATEVLNHFDLTKESFKGGYYYSIAELVGIYLCKSPFLLHFSSDSYMTKYSHFWIYDAVQVLQRQNNIIVANAVWNDKYNEAKNESIDENNDFYIGYGFSDQCYLVNKNLFASRIYGETHETSMRYPKYGGELFEKRVDSFMRNKNLLRITSKDASYIHKNFPKSSIFSKIALFRNIIVYNRLRK